MVRGIGIAALSLFAIVVSASLCIRAIVGGPRNIAAAVEIGAVFSMVFAIAAVVVDWPILRLLNSSPRWVFHLATAVLTFVPLLGFMLLFRDGDDPGSITGYLRLWWHVPGEFLAGFLPLAGATFVVGRFAAACRPPN